MRWLASASAGIEGYRLSIGTRSGDYDPTLEVDIPLVDATVESDGSLSYDIELLDGRDHYLAMRAYDSTSFSPLSNEIEVAATSSEEGGGATASSVGPGSTSAASLSSGSAGGATGGVSAIGSAPASGDPDAAGGALPTVPAGTGVSLDLNGIDEYLASTLAGPLRSDGFTASLWGRVPLDDAANRRGLLQLDCALDADACGVEISLVNDAGGPVIELRLFDPAAGLDDVVQTPAPIVADRWWHLVVAIDEPTGVARIFLDGELLILRSGLEISPALSESDYFVALGAGRVGRSDPWPGQLGHAAIWNALLGEPEIAEISMRGHELDLRTDVGDYRGASALGHYWRLGHDPAALGLDSGLAPPLDLDDPSGNVDARNIVSDAPASLVP